MAPAINLDRWLKALNQKLPVYETEIRDFLVNSEKGKHSAEIYITDFIGGSFLKELEGFRYLQENVEQRFQTTFLSDIVSSKTEVFVIFHTYFSFFFEKIEKESTLVFKKFNVNAKIYGDLSQHKINFLLLKEADYLEKNTDFENAYFQIAEIISSNLTEMIINYQSVLDCTQPKFFMKTGVRYIKDKSVLFETNLSVFRSNDILFSAVSEKLVFAKSFIDDIEKLTLPLAKKYLEKFNDTNLSKQALSVSSLLLHSPNSWGCELSYEESKLGLLNFIQQMFRSIYNNSENYDTLFFIEDENPVLTVKKDTSRRYFFDYGSFSLERVLYLGRYSVGMEIHNGKSNFRMHDYENTSFSLEAQKILTQSFYS